MGNVWQGRDRGEYPVLDNMKRIYKRPVSQERCPDDFQAVCAEVQSLQKAFIEFQKELEAQSEVCRFFGTLLDIVQIVKNAVASDRDGIWDLYVATVEDSMPVFAGFDCINYLRYGSLYLEQIKTREVSHYNLFRKFEMGNGLSKIIQVHFVPLVVI